ncbi:MAG: type II toxin-antitoxin system PemK/MazF family toxin [Pusillimonas sp.]|nr:type II toxin-antitoxin system PemK/MazF family toxin [Pusillimonas sp.]
MRGDLVTIAMQGDFGKPRPAVIVQSNHFIHHPTVSVLLVTSKVVNAPLLRITLEPNETNGLEHPSQVMIDKIMTVRREKIGAAFGRVDNNVLMQIDRTLAVFLGIAK